MIKMYCWGVSPDKTASRVGTSRAFPSVSAAKAAFVNDFVPRVPRGHLVKSAIYGDTQLHGIGHHDGGVNWWRGNKRVV